VAALAVSAWASHKIGTAEHEFLKRHIILCNGGVRGCSGRMVGQEIPCLAGVALQESWRRWFDVATAS